MSAPHLAIVGATGAVGVEMLSCLEERNFPLSRLTLLASSRSAGKTVSFREKTLSIQELTPHSFSGVDIALFSAGGSISREYAPYAAAAGATVIDNSSAFRMDDDVPLVVPEINPEEAKNAPRGIISNPNCTTIVTLMGLYPLHRAFGLRSVIASTYQAVSGSGQQGIQELENQMLAYTTGQPIQSHVYPHQIVANLIPHVDAFEDDGYTKEEDKMLNESQKILNHPDLRVTCTCVRVPVTRSHSVSVTAQFEKPITVAAAREVLSKGFPGLKLLDEPHHPKRPRYPVPLDATGKDDCLIGRIRQDRVLENALALWIVGDQVRKGAALNAVQITELLLS